MKDQATAISREDLHLHLKGNIAHSGICISTINESIGVRGMDMQTIILQRASVGRSLIRIPVSWRVISQRFSQVRLLARDLLIQLHGCRLLCLDARANMRANLIDRYAQANKD